MKHMVPRDSRSGVSAIVGAVILFSMIFTVGAGYFTFIAQNQQILNTETLSRSQTENERTNESYGALSSIIQSNNNIGLNITNTGSVATKLVAIIMSNSSWVKVLDGQVGQQTTPNLPLYLNPSASTGIVDTGIVPTSGQNYSIKILSERGNMFQTTYPEVADPIIAQTAITTINAAVGNLLLNYNSLQSCKPVTQDCRPSSTAWTGGWELTPGSGTRYLFRAEIANYASKPLLLEKRTGFFLLHVQEGGGGSIPSDLYIVSPPNVDNTSTDGAGAYTDWSTSLASGGSYVTVYFGADDAGGSTLRNFDSGDAGVHLTTIVIFGYSDQDNSGTKNSGDSPYGQSIPFEGIVIS